MLVTVTTSGDDDVTLETDSFDVDRRGRLTVADWQWQAEAWRSVRCDKTCDEE